MAALPHHITCSPGETQVEALASKPDPVALLQQVHAAGEGLLAKTAITYLTEIRADRKKWRGQFIE